MQAYLDEFCSIVMAIEACQCQADLLKTLKNKINYLTEHKNMKLKLSQHPSLTTSHNQLPYYKLSSWYPQAVFFAILVVVSERQSQRQSLQALKFFRVQNKFKLLKKKGTQLRRKTDFKHDKISMLVKSMKGRVVKQKHEKPISKPSSNFSLGYSCSLRKGMDLSTLTLKSYQ